MRFVTKHQTNATSWTVANGVSMPVGHILCRLGNTRCIAYVTFKVGTPRWGEEHGTEVTILWPRWIPVPVELLVRAPEPEPLDEASGLLVITKLGESWEHDEIAFRIGDCTSAASAAATQMEQVLATKKNHGNVFYLNGPTGSGKTTAVMILAHRLGGRFLEYDFTSFKADFCKLIKDARPSADHPLIMSVSEADKKVEQIAGTDASVKRLTDRREIYDKHTFLKLLDEVNFQREHIVFAMSGNTPFQVLQKSLNDPAYTRDTRMTVINVGGDERHDRGEATFTADPSVGQAKVESDSDSDEDTGSDADDSDEDSGEVV